MSLDQIADRLYALPPEEFTAARTAEAKAADGSLAKQVGALRKPTVGAWLVNTLARTEPALLDQLLDLGPALAEAQSGGQGEALRMLGEQRRQLVAAVTARAFEAAARQPVAAARAEVESTLDAALADPATAEAVRSGRLVRALSYAGFGGVDVTGAVAAPPASAKAPKPKQDVAAAEARALETAGALDDAVRACEQAKREAERATGDAAAAADAVAEAEQALSEVRGRRTAAEATARKAARRVDQAAQAVIDAQAKAEKARNALDKLRRG